MMTRVRISSLLAVFLFMGLLALLVANRQTLVDAHIDESILKVASDATVYFDVYYALYEDLSLAESPALFLVGSPVLFLKLSGGNLFLVELCNLLLMMVSVFVALRALSTFRGRMLFLVMSMLFPYFAFGFLGLNKEIYAMSSAIFFGSYYILGKRSHLIFALLIGACARYYMLIALLTLLFTVPRVGPVRYGRMLAVLAAASMAAPLAALFVPQYSAEGLLEGASFASTLFSTLINNFAYGVAYPLKYLVLIPSRAYAFLVGASEDAMGGMVSILSLVVLFWALAILRDRRRPADPLIKRLVIAGLAAPIPIMWSEIMHWRYYSFVYFFFLYAIVLNGEARARRASRPAPAVGALPA